LWEVDGDELVLIILLSSSLMTPGGGSPFGLKVLCREFLFHVFIRSMSRRVLNLQSIAISSRNEEVLSAFDGRERGLFVMFEYVL
jgi:hypothetical protein